jgi:3D (Asp-Asp-Asp) domain-containing protein
MEFGHMIYGKEIDIYLEAKQQSKANKAITVISILAHI